MSHFFQISKNLYRIYDSILDTIGNTPVIKINRLLSKEAQNRNINLYGKCEFFNPLGSVKDRLALAVINQAEKENKLKPNMTIVEATSGNTGSLGAKVILTPGHLYGKGMVDKAKELANYHGWFYTQQFENPANPLFHSNTTAAEIINDFSNKSLDYWITGYGTGGTFIGVSRILKIARPETKIVLVEPKSAALIKSGLPQKRHNDKSPSEDHKAFSPHSIQGWVPSFLPWICQEGVDYDYANILKTVTNEEALETSNQLGKLEGIYTGISGGATTAIAIKIAESAPDNSNILTMLADTQERYQNSILYKNITSDMNEEELLISRSTPYAQFLEKKF